jgi:hypothetical protein
MRIRLTSGLLTPLAMAGAVLCALPSGAHAWDEDRIQSQIQPYIGVWTGMYLVNHQDLDNLTNYNNSSLGNSFFSSELPAVGGSFGVAYGRVHVGLNGGYQLVDGGKFPYTVSVPMGGALPPLTYLTSSYDYRYQVIPVDINVDVALLPNQTPVNLLLGGSAGIGFVGMELPFYQLASYPDSAHVKYTEFNNDWIWNNYLLATAYVGARINLAKRLNLEVQVGWRFLKSSEVYLGHNTRLVQSTSQTYSDSTGKMSASGDTAQIPIDLSDAYVRADIRWTFASREENDEDRASERARRMHDILAMMPSSVKLTRD